MKAIWLSHEFNVHAPTVTWNDVPGIYIFTKLNKERNLWEPLYIGQADSFANRLSNHNKWDAAVRRGLTHIHAMTVRLQSDRDAIEKQLIQHFQPPLNVQLK